MVQFQVRFVFLVSCVHMSYFSDVHCMSLPLRSTLVSGHSLKNRAAAASLSSICGWSRGCFQVKTNRRKHRQQEVE